MINMRLDSGQVKVINNTKDIHVIDDTLTMGRLTAAKHDSGITWWITAHKWESNRFYKLLITPDSVLGPYDQFTGAKIPFYDL